MRDTVIRFVASTRGRWARIGIGSLLFAGGVARHKPVLCVAGAVFAGIALVDVYPPAAFFGRSVRGKRLRRELGMRAEAPLLG